MAAFTDVVDGDTVDAADIMQLIEVLKGTGSLANVPVSITGINDASNYALSVKNADTVNGRTAQFLDSSGNQRLRLASAALEADSTGSGTLSHVVTRTATETLLNKTLSSGTKVTLGSDATGDMYYRNSSGELTRIAAGSSGQGIIISGGVPTFGEVTGLDFGTMQALLG